MEKEPRQGFGEPKLRDAQQNIERLKQSGKDAVAAGDYQTATSVYNLLITTALIEQNHDAYIEASLRLAGITHKQGNETAALEFVGLALAFRESTGSEFDIDEFLAAD